MGMICVQSLERGRLWYSEIARAAATPIPQLQLQLQLQLEHKLLVAQKPSSSACCMVRTKSPPQLTSTPPGKPKFTAHQLRGVAHLWLQHSTNSAQLQDGTPCKIMRQEANISHKNPQKVLLEAALYKPGSNTKFAPPAAGKLEHIEQLWLQFFSNPLDWWDNRLDKANQLNGTVSRRNRHFPDFKHKTTHEALWEDSRLNPSWVKAKLVNVTGCREQSGKASILEKRWQKFFSNPSRWWDHRFDKSNVRYPDFKHKGTEESLWIDNRLTPNWVKFELAALNSGATQRSVYSWNIMLEKLVKNRQHTQALDLYRRMQMEGIDPDNFTFVRVLNACAGAAALREGRHVHVLALESSYSAEIIVGNCLVDMYGKCGSIEDACKVFNNMQTHDVVSWTVLIGAYISCGQGEKALILFEQIQRENFEPDIVSFVSILNACANLEALEEGRHIHGQVIQKEYEADVFVANCLLDMYSKTGSIEDACRVFNNMAARSAVAWSAMMGGYVKWGDSKKAFDLFGMMQQEEVKPDNVTIVVVLNACAGIAALEDGRKIHAQINEEGWGSDTVVSNCLIDMYVKCGSTEDACRVFNAMSRHTVVSWNAMMGGYVKCGQGKEALDLFRQMRREQAHADSVTFVAALNSCASILSLEEGRIIHEYIMQTEYGTNAIVNSSLVDMYSKCGSMVEACRVFNSMPIHDVVCWSALIGGYVKAGEGMKALEAYRLMEFECVEPDIVTFVGVINACACSAALKEGRRAHNKVSQIGYESNLMVSNALIDMYIKCDSLDEAFTLFSTMPKHDTVSWNSMIVGCVKCGQAEIALELFHQMQLDQVEPDTVTFVGALIGCSNLAALDEGRHVHKQVIVCGFKSEITVCNCLIDMYAKCGSIEDAYTVFKDMAMRDVISWNNMIKAYAMHGLGTSALRLFSHEDVLIDNTTFVCLLSALSHTGLLDAGQYFFESICAVYCISITAEHCSCMVDLFGRAGRLPEAEDIINKMPCRPTRSVWMALLGACRVHDNLEIGEHAAMQLLELDPDNASGYVMLSNMYAGAGRWVSKSKA